MKFTCFFLGVFLVKVAALSKDEKTHIAQKNLFTAHFGKDCPGHDIYYPGKAKLQQCLDICESKSSCVAVTWSDGGDCFPKHKLCKHFSTKSQKKNFFVKETVKSISKANGFKAYLGMDCPGNHLSYPGNLPLQKCLDLCDKHTRCVAVNWHLNGDCYPKDNLCGRNFDNKNPTNNFIVKDTVDRNEDKALKKGFNLYPGRDCPENDIFYPGRKTLDECIDICLDLSSCVAILWSHDGSCYPKSKACTNFSKDNPRGTFLVQSYTKARKGDGNILIN